MKIVFAHQWNEPDKPEHPLGPAYVLSYLRNKSKFTDLAIVSASGKLATCVLEQKPDLLGLYAYTAQIDRITEIAQRVKDAAEIPVVLGGPHISSLPESLPRVFDAGVVGEGEETFLELATLFSRNRHPNQQELQGINGVVFHAQGSTVLTSARKEIADIDALPLPARDLFDQDELQRPLDFLFRHRLERGVEVFSARGCPYKCRYCQQAAFGHKARLHSAEYVVNEIEELYKTYRPTVISFSDDLFAVRKGRVREVIDKLKQKELLGKFRFRVDVRANLVDDEMVELFKEMGVVSTSLGIESGSNRVMQSLKGSNVSLEQTWRAVEKLNGAGVSIYGCFMLGAPDETLEEMEGTARLMKRFLAHHRYNYCNVNPLTPLPKTALYEECRKEGLIPADVPWEEFGFSMKAFKKRRFHICKNVSRKQHYRLLRKMYRIRRNKFYSSLLGVSPLRGVKELFRAMGRRFSGR